ncbi:MAG: hypothetical protein H0T47_09825 [Planctomycetaceae bacterium]|nr:hypothetical protein [Planctomycetaceae bacterium]
MVVLMCLGHAAVGCSGDDEVYIPDTVPPRQDLRASGERGGNAADGNRSGGDEQRKAVRPIGQ